MYITQSTNIIKVSCKIRPGIVLLNQTIHKIRSWTPLGGEGYSISVNPPRFTKHLPSGEAKNVLGKLKSFVFIPVILKIRNIQLNKSKFIKEFRFLSTKKMTAQQNIFCGFGLSSTHTCIRLIMSEKPWLNLSSFK